MVVDSLIDVVNNKLADVFIDGCAGILVGVGFCDMGIIVVAAALIDFEFAVAISCAADVLAVMMVAVLVDVLTGVLTGVMICLAVIDIGVDALAVVNISVLTAVMTVEINMPAPLGKPLFFCGTAFSCWPMVVSECTHVLQAWMPSCHA